MSLRTVTHILSDLSPEDRALLKSGQRAAGRIYAECVIRHRTARQTSQRWPTYEQLASGLKKTEADVCAQTQQQIIKAFIANVDSTRTQRAKGRKEMRYPWRTPPFYPLIWPAQAVIHREGAIELPLGGMGKNRRFIALAFEGAEAVESCRIIWAHGCYEFQYQTTVPDDIAPDVPAHPARACIDLGEIVHGAVVTDTDNALVVSGRGIRTLKQGRNRTISELGQKMARCTKYSRQWKKYKKAQERINGKTKRRVRDLRNKAVHQEVDFLVEQGVTEVYIGNPHGVRSRNCGRHHNLRMAQWEYGQDIQKLTAACKKKGIVVRTGSERGSSSRCPECGRRMKSKNRVWRCKVCHLDTHRDIVGATNMFANAEWEHAPVPSLITYRQAGPLPKVIGSRRRSRAEAPPRSRTFAPKLVMKAMPQPPTGVPSSGADTETPLVSSRVSRSPHRRQVASSPLQPAAS